MVPKKCSFIAQADAKPSELSSNALAALQEFYTEREETETTFEDLRASVELQAFKGQLNMKSFSEDWNSSQFWYSDATAKLLAEQLLEDATSQMRIAVVCAPSVFVQLKNMIAPRKEVPDISLLEFDNRFDVFEEFVHYDFKDPFKLPNSMRAAYDRILCDPPFLSLDCQTKVAMTVRWLSKSQLMKNNISMQRIIVCTGATMESTVQKLYVRTRTTSFEPKHAQDRLSNEFRCYADFEGSAWSWRITKEPTAVRAANDATKIVS
jgi:hypothetical protein